MKNKIIIFITMMFIFTSCSSKIEKCSINKICTNSIEDGIKLRISSHRPFAMLCTCKESDNKRK